MSRTIKLALSSLAFLLASPGAAQQPPKTQAVLEAPKMIANPYTAYEFLIGDWYSKPTGGA